MEVTLLTQERCAFCDDAKEILERLSREFPFGLRVVDIDSDEGAALAERGGVMFPPGIFFDSDAISYGRPSERRLRRELERRLATTPGHGRR